MGFSYRKSFKAGPIRVSASKSGISYSAGGKGARVTRQANGRVRTTVGGGGVRYSKTTGPKPRRKPQAAARRPPRQPSQPMSAKAEWIGAAVFLALVLLVFVIL